MSGKARWSSVGAAIALTVVGLFVGSWQRLTGDFSRAFAGQPTARPSAPPATTDGTHPSQSEV